MSFIVRLASDSIGVEAGVTTPLDIEISNRSEATDQYELSVEGIDPEWTAVPVPSFSISAHDIQTQKIFLKPPRSSESLAGNYPFVVKVRSLESGEVRQAQGVLEIRPYHHVSMEILPKKGIYTALRKQNSFRVTIMNLGNSEHTLQLFGSDPEDALTYELESEQVTVAPGQQKEVEVVATPTQAGLLSSPRLHGFQMSGRSVDTPSVSCTAQAQLEQRPVIGPGNLAIALVFLLLVIGWIAFMPKPPTMDSLMLDRTTAAPGDTVELKWRSSNAKSVRITFNDKTIVSAGAPNGSTTYAVDQSGTFSAVAIRDSASSTQFSQVIAVKAPAMAPAPTVDNFEIKTREIEPGMSFFVTYKTSNAIKVTLSPSGQVLDPKLESVQVEAPNTAGWIKYMIIAENATGQIVKSRTISVNVVQKPKAVITTFRADPMEVDPLIGKTTITWQITGATRAELIVDGVTMALDKTEGETTIDVTKTVQVVLVGYDENNMTVKKSATIKMKTEDPPPDDSHTNPPPTTKGGGTQ